MGIISKGNLKKKMYVFNCANFMEQKYLTAAVAKKIEHRIKSKEKWGKTITVPVEVFTEGVAV